MKTPEEIAEHLYATNGWMYDKKPTGEDVRRVRRERNLCEECGVWVLADHVPSCPNHKELKDE